MPATPPVRNATSSAFGIDPLRAAAAVRTLPRTARLMPMKPVSPDKKQPSTKRRVRNPPDSANVNATPPSACFTAVDVANTTIASGTRMTAIVLNCRFR